MQIDHYVSERRRKQKKRRKYFLAVGAFLVIYFIFLGIFVFIVRLPAFQEDRIVVNGNTTVPSSQIVDLLQGNIINHHWINALLGINNMLIWPSSLPSTTLSMVPQLASLNISKDYFLHTITIAVTERQPFAVWCFVGSDGSMADAEAIANTEANALSSLMSDTLGNESCFWFDQQGTLFEPTLDTEGGLTTVVHDYTGDKPAIGATVLPAEFTPNLISIINAVKESGLAIQDIALHDLSLEEIDITTINGPDVYFSLRFPADNDIPVLESLMAKPGFNKLQYIDFRVENRAYYK
jgi:hypothetical protein